MAQRPSSRRNQPAIWFQLANVWLTTQEKCGLVNEAHPCRCAKKTIGFMKAGFLDPQKLLFAREHVTRVREVAEKTYHGLDALDQAYGEIHRAHRFQSAPDFVASLRDLLNRPDFKSIVELE